MSLLYVPRLLTNAGISHISASVALLEDANWSAVAPEVGKVSSRQPVSAMVLAHIVPTSMFLNIVFIADVSFLIRRSH